MPAAVSTEGPSNAANGAFDGRISNTRSFQRASGHSARCSGPRPYIQNARRAPGVRRRTSRVSGPRGPGRTLAKAAARLHRIRQEMRLGEANQATFAIPN